MDIRLPVSFLFMIIGLLLVIYGLFAGVLPFAGYNLDVLWGLVMGVFGVALYLLSRRSRHE